MLTYNDLYEFLRKEKYGETLQGLPATFLTDYSDFLTNLKESFSGEENSFLDSLGKSKKELENSISLFKELILRRKRKLLNLVFVAAETGIMKRDFDNMLSTERETFEKLVKAFEENDKEISKLLTGRGSKEVQKHKMIIFNQSVEQFVDMFGNVIGPFSAGELANLETEVCAVLVSSAKASFVES